jgi:hypothetical protein
MAEGTSSGGNGWLAFIVGGLLVVVAAFGYMYYTGQGPSQVADRNLDIKIEAPKLPEAPALPKAPEMPAPTAPDTVPAPN